MNPTVEARIAAISDTAVTRHQYHRMMSTNPMPAPDSSMISQACRTDSKTNVTDALKIRISSVTTLAITISRPSVAAGLMNRLYQSFTT
jgi:hypothetical protein